MSNPKRKKYSLTEQEGVLKQKDSGPAVLRDPARSFRAGGREVVVPSQLIEKYQLTDGVLISGKSKRNKEVDELVLVESICGVAPEEYLERQDFTRLTAIDPDERFNLSAAGEPAMRIVDLIAPIGKGTRGMIVSPPKAGKTTLLEQIANGIHTDDPDTRIIVLLIDERPEEVTYFRRAVEAEVFYSSSDQGIEDHVELAELTLAHVRTELECGRDVVVLVDSLTRMGRAFNQSGTGSGRTLSGGLDARALEIPRRFFGLARNIEGGGSVTIIATALVYTGSRMDQLIFEEFKGTGNSEIVLDRQLADSRIFPAINVLASGTRKEERLLDADLLRQSNMLRRMLVDRSPKDAMQLLLNLVRKYPTNRELLQNLNRR